LEPFLKFRVPRNWFWNLFSKFRVLSTTGFRNPTKSRVFKGSRTDSSPCQIGTLFKILGSKKPVLEFFFKFRVLSKTGSKNPKKSRVLGTGSGPWTISLVLNLVAN
jgi:hypothetical protein